MGSCSIDQRGLGRGGFDQVADAPGHDDARPIETAIAALGGTQYAGDVLALGGFLAQKQPHGVSESCCIALVCKMPCASAFDFPKTECGSSQF